jgi:hypothetical protein
MAIANGEGLCSGAEPTQINGPADKLNQDKKD